MGGKPRANGSEFDSVFESLCGILRRHHEGLTASTESDTELVYTGPVMERWNKELWFGGAKIGRAYVSYHLMPVYMYPDLLDGISPELRARMQGKSCFNFKTSDPALFAELSDLTTASVERLRAEGIL